MRVRDLMSPHVVAVRETVSCRRAVHLMSERKIRHLPVLDADGTLVGIVSDGDLRRHAFAAGVFRDAGPVPVDQLLDAVPVRAVMSAPVVTVGPDEPIDAAARLMLEDRIDSVPVMLSGRLVGILTERDLVRHMIEQEATDDPADRIVVSYP
jgi:acetoin utilization protein AcuB